jgi:hypothetical protein
MGPAPGSICGKKLTVVGEEGTSAVGDPPVEAIIMRRDTPS